MVYMAQAGEADAAVATFDVVSLLLGAGGFLVGTAGLILAGVTFKREKDTRAAVAKVSEQVGRERTVRDLEDALSASTFDISSNRGTRA